VKAKGPQKGTGGATGKDKGPTKPLANAEKKGTPVSEPEADHAGPTSVKLLLLLLPQAGHRISVGALRQRHRKGPQLQVEHLCASPENCNIITHVVSLIVIVILGIFACYTDITSTTHQ
jgi:hypothetical protein